MRFSDWSSDVCSSDLVRIFADVSPLQMREFMLDSTVGFYRRGEVVFEKGEPGSSLFAIAEGHAEVEVAPGVTVPIEEGSIFGEVGLISGRKRGATIRAGADSIFVEVSRTARSEEHTSELQSLMRISYAVFCLKKKKQERN